VVIKVAALSHALELSRAATAAAFDLVLWGFCRSVREDYLTSHVGYELRFSVSVYRDALRPLRAPHLGAAMGL